MFRQRIFSKVNSEYVYYVVLLVVVFLVLVAWKHNWLSRLTNSEVTGKIIDISENAPVELVLVKGGLVPAYTNYQGQFSVLVSGRGAPQLKIENPKGFEPFNKSIDCGILSNTWAVTDVSYLCQALLYPQPTAIASRILVDEVAVPLAERGERNGRKKRLWSRSSQTSREAFGSEGDFTVLLMDKEEFEIKKGKQMVGYSVSDDFKVLDEFLDPLTSKTLKNVAEVDVSRFFSDSLEVKSKEYFIKENRVWRYLIPYSRYQLLNFIAIGDRVLKIKK